MVPQPRLRRVITGLGLMFAASPVSAVSGHEFWIEPEDYAIAQGEEIRADIKVGQDFKGDIFPFIASRFVTFERHDRVGDSDVEGTAGDLPALSATPRSEGLTLFTYLSTERRLTFVDWDKFTSYLDYEGLTAIAARHDARGLPRDRISEIYIRCAKTLVNVGPDATGQDRATGLPLELVAEQNPGALTPGQAIRFRLLWQGAPLPDTQVALFARSGDTPEATRTLTRTDADGYASFTLPATGGYMAASVHMIEPAADGKADWQSYWASLTFGVE
ncbi:DUF4198 domain-containing protein [Hoeflea sp.]|uniref:DUF4198 domain-containing protein n=1 Tax=Hoeflea sp. TaxID=1940281 RepID=UPI00374818A9